MRFFLKMNRPTGWLPVCGSAVLRPPRMSTRALKWGRRRRGRRPGPNVPFLVVAPLVAAETFDGTHVSVCVASVASRYQGPTHLARDHLAARRVDTDVMKWGGSWLVRRDVASAVATQNRLVLDFLSAVRTRPHLTSIHSSVQSSSIVLVGYPLRGFTTEHGFWVSHRNRTTNHRPGRQAEQGHAPGTMGVARGVLHLNAPRWPVSQVSLDARKLLSAGVSRWSG